LSSTARRIPAAWRECPAASVLWALRTRRGARLLPGLQRCESVTRFTRQLLAQQGHVAQGPPECSNVARIKSGGLDLHRAVPRIEDIQQCDGIAQLLKCGDLVASRRPEPGKLDPARRMRGQLRRDVARAGGIDSAEQRLQRLQYRLTLGDGMLNGGRMRRVIRDLLLVSRDNHATAINSRLGPRPEFRRRAGGHGMPLRHEVFDDRRIGTVEGLVYVVLDGCAQCAHGLERGAYGPLLRIDRVTLLLEYPVDVLVFAACVFQQALQQRRILHSGGRELPNRGRSSGYRQIAKQLLVSNRLDALRQQGRICRAAGNGQQR
jgi:hypothetical protein